MVDNLEAHFDKAVQDVFATMLNCELERTPAEGWSMNSEPYLASCVGFLGTVNGVAYLYTTEVFARRMAARLLGMTDAEVDTDEMVNDAMGEIANMVVGPVKSRLSDNGLPCVLTIPSIVRGTNFNIEPCGLIQRSLFGYRCPEGTLFVEVLIKNDEAC